MQGLRVALDGKIREVMHDCSSAKVLKEGVVQPNILHKARMRIAIELSACLAVDSPTPDCCDSVSDYEIERAALTIAHAMVNPYYVNWDAERYGNSVKLPHPNRNGLPTGEPERLRKFYPEADLGRISAPATIVDKHGRILTIYLPNILSSSRLEYVNTATKGLKTILLRSTPTNTTAKTAPWRSAGFCAADGGGEFGMGRVTVSPAYFMQRQERIQDPLVTSSSYGSKEVQAWLAALSTTESFWNAITAAAAPDLFEAGSAAMSKVLQEVSSSNSRKPLAVSQWPSIYSGLEVIANRVTPSHRDRGGSPTLHDLLVSLGTGHAAKITLADVRAELDYFPGTMLYISGIILEHAVGPWDSGERFVIAHFMRDRVHDRMEVPRPAFPMQSHFLEMVAGDVCGGRPRKKPRQR